MTMMEKGARVVTVRPSMLADGTVVDAGRYAQVLAVSGRSVAVVLSNGTEHGQEAVVPMSAVRYPMEISYGRVSGGNGYLGSSVEHSECGECHAMVSSDYRSHAGHRFWHEKQQPEVFA